MPKRMAYPEVPRLSSRLPAKRGKKKPPNEPAIPPTPTSDATARWGNMSDVVVNRFADQQHGRQGTDARDEQDRQHAAREDEHGRLPRARDAPAAAREVAGEPAAE